MQLHVHLIIALVSIKTDRKIRFEFYCWKKLQNAILISLFIAKK